MINSTTITYALPIDAESPDIIIEQVPWDEYMGVVTIGVVVENLKTMLYDYDAPETNCGIENNQWEGQINVYPVTPRLPYKLGVSHGSVGAGLSETFEHTENIHFNLSDVETLTYFAQGVVSIEWLDGAYDCEGGVIPYPTVTVDENNVMLSSKSYCTLMVTYSVFRNVHTVTVPERAVAEENRYTSVAFARYSGGVVWKQLEPPENADITQDCGWTFIGEQCGPPIILADRVTQYEYCLGEFEEGEPVIHTVLSDEFRNIRESEDDSSC